MVDLLNKILQKKIKKPLGLLLLFLLLGFGFFLVDAKDTRACRENVCPPGDVKYETDGGYEYTDDSGFVTIVPAVDSGHNSAEWSPEECYTITGVCIKIGGPGGGSLIYPDPVIGAAGPYGYDISHVVLTTDYTCQECPQEDPCPDFCHTDIIIVNAGDCGEKICEPNAPAEESCPTHCDYSGGQVADGNCGYKDCPATDPCEEPTPSPTPTLEPTPEPTPTDEPSSPGPPVCGASTPNAPFLVSATAIGGNQVELVWQKVDGATHYSIFYGPSSGNYLYGVPNTGDTDNFTIGGMSGGCYIVQAVNDCAPSEASNEICIGQVAGQVLGLSTTSGEKDTSPALFWAGILALLTGAKVLTRELEKKNL